MPNTPTFPLDNYLKAHRKRSGLTQYDIAFLLGCKTAATVSRYELRRRLPSLRAALAYSAILGVPAERLFAGVRQKVAMAVAERVEELMATLSPGELPASGPLDNARLRSLNDCKGRILSQTNVEPDIRTGPRAGDSPP